MIAFQIVFGLTVFALTRQAYQQPMMDQPVASTGSQPMSSPASGSGIGSGGSLGSLSTFSMPMSNDPVELARQANEYFSFNQYERAAALYEQLLTLVPDNAEIHNNLGITLHYLGRTADALDRLEQGVAADPDYQRIWLTLGFVNTQAGNLERARTALETAVAKGADNDVGQSAAQMLKDLPPG